MSDAFKREIDKGTLPGATVMVARRGQIGWFEALGRQSPDGFRADGAEYDLPHLLDDQADRLDRHHDAWSKKAISLLSDPVAKFIPEFADQKVGVENNGKLDLVPPERPMTIQDLLRHTSGITYDHTGNGLVQQLYQQSRLRSRKISNAEHAALVASLPLMCQPGAEWNYSRSTDILGRIIEVVSGKTLGAFLTERILAPLQMTETAFHTGEENAGRLAEPFAADPWTGEKVQLFNMLEKPVMESGGGGLVSTTMDYARFCQMLLNGGTLDGNRIIGRKTLELMASNHLGPNVKRRIRPDAGRPRLRPRLCGPHRSGHGAVPGLGRPVLLERHGRHVLLDRPERRAVHGVHDAGPRPARIYPHAGAESGVRGGGVSRAFRVRPDAAQRAAVRCRSAFETSRVPALRSSVKNAAPRPGHASQLIVAPPSITIVCPVMNVPAARCQEHRGAGDFVGLADPQQRRARGGGLQRLRIVP